jgi:tetratricopeptide (TPR) repeat protein
LKAAGNAFHVEGKYRKAYTKYSEAIKIDSTNAVLYANRAASALSMKEYLDAGSDAKQAVDLDPTYTKAWVRLGKAFQGVGSWAPSESAYEKALSLLPGECSAQEKTLKKQCEDGLKFIRETLNRLSKQENDSFVRVPAGEVKIDELPWHRAVTMMDELESTKNPNSSAWVIMNAHREFAEGVELMKRTRFVVNVGWDPQSNPTALSTMSHGILRDQRAFEMSDPRQWEEMYNRQVAFEHAARESWVRGGPRQVKKEAIQRLKSFGWVLPLINMSPHSNIRVGQ